MKRKDTYSKIVRKNKIIKAITWVVLVAVVVANLFMLVFAVEAADFNDESQPMDVDPVSITPVVQSEHEPFNPEMVKADAYIEPSEPVCEAPEAPVPAETEPQYTLGDLETLAQVICYEAGGEDTEIQILVGCVIRNRVESELFPNTYYEVVTQPGQYGRLSEWGPFWPKWADEGIKNHCRKIARMVISGEVDCPHNVIYQASFKQGSGVYEYYDGYYFCYE